MTAKRTARSFRTGSTPGSPRQTGHTCVFAGAPNRVEQEQKILLSVLSCAWTSRPMTGKTSILLGDSTVDTKTDVSTGVRIRAVHEGRPDAETY